MCCQYKRWQKCNFIHAEIELLPFFSLIYKTHWWGILIYVTNNEYVYFLKLLIDTERDVSTFVCFTFDDISVEIAVDVTLQHEMVGGLRVQVFRTQTTVEYLLHEIFCELKSGCRRGQGGGKCTKSDIINLFFTHRDIVCLKR